MKQKAISILLTLSLLAGSLFCFSSGAGALYYSQGQKIARAITDEGLVLLKNENEALPIAPGACVAVFGDAQRLRPSDSDLGNMKGYFPYSYGSESQAGDFEGREIDPLDALLEAEKNG